METDNTINVSVVSTIESNLRERILAVSGERFWESGFSKVTMDELAYDLGISKKTLYIHFPSKKRLFKEALMSDVHRIEAGLKNILEARDSSFIEKLSDLMVFINHAVPKPGRAFFRDMKRHAGGIWQEIEEERTRVLREHFGRFLDSGIRKGVLRQGIDRDVVITVLVTLVRELINPEVLSRSSKTLPEAYEEVFGILFLGILTEGGRKAYSPRPRLSYGHED